MNQTYPLTAAQNMHYRWIREYKTQQVSGLSIVAAFQFDVNIETLKKEVVDIVGKYYTSPSLMKTARYSSILQTMSRKTLK